MQELSARFQEMLVDIRSGRIARVLTRSGDIGLIGALAAMVALMIVPLPTWLLDIFLSVNITGALIILMVSVYIPSAVQISSYPTLLLITTLYRLSLDISATRLILLHANAGEVVASFGQFVVAGNYVVGAVIFLIITLVQFIVITKGAERVAEVAARFTLDAIPGKQMSIDADLRAGTINYEQARTKRELLSRESQFYGAMDGAMKFVKGDAIAGIVITLINIIAGLIIGIAMHGMTAGEAAQTYSVLTIGSGLVSQIPALLISISAGIVVTRVGGGDGKDSNLGSQVVGQVVAQPKAVAVAAGLVLILALIPGLPKLPFFLLALAVGAVAWKLLSATPADLADEDEETPEQAAAKPIEGAAQVQGTLPLALKTGRKLGELLTNFETESAALRNSLYYELGVPFPPIPVAAGPGLADDAFEIWLNEIPVYRASIRLDCHLIPESTIPLASFGVKAEPARNPLNGRVAAWVPSAQAPLIASAGLTTWDPFGVLKLHLTAFLCGNAAEFLGLQEVHSIVERVRELYPNLAEQVTPKPVPLHVLAEVLRCLVREQVSIRDLRNIFESLAQHGRVDENPENLAEHIRRDIRERLCYQLSGGQPLLQASNLSPKFTEMFKMSIRRGPNGSTINLPTKGQDEFLAAARRCFGNLPATAQTPVVMCDTEIRLWVRRILSSQFPEVRVLGYEQFSPKLNLSMLRQVE